MSSLMLAAPPGDVFSGSLLSELYVSNVSISVVVMDGSAASSIVNVARVSWLAPWSSVMLMTLNVLADSMTLSSLILSVIVYEPSLFR